jgi:PAS domain S-box-containing protein
MAPPMALGLFHFQLLHQVLERIHFVYNDEDMAQTVLESVSQALYAEGGTIFRLQPDGHLAPLACYGAPIERLRAIPFSKGRGVVGWVVEHGQPVKVDRPSQDTRFVGSADAATGFKTRNIIAAPIMAHGETVGVIEFLNKKEGAFTIPDLELVSMVGREVGIAFENVRLVRKLRATQALLGAMTDSLSAGILMVDQNRNILRVNPSALRILGARDAQDQWAGRPVADKLAHLPEFLTAVDAVVGAAAAVPRSEVQVIVGSQRRVIGYSGSPVKDETGERLGSALLFQDITAFQKPA